MEHLGFGFPIFRLGMLNPLSMQALQNKTNKQTNEQKPSKLETLLVSEFQIRDIQPVVTNSWSCCKE
jgi:hypothetical protein